MDKPTMNYAVAYQRFRSTLNGTMINLQKEYPLPTYMIEGIVAGILADIRSAAIAESNSEEQSFAKENAEYYEKQLQELNDELLKLKAEKENSDDESRTTIILCYIDFSVYLIVESYIVCRIAFRSAV